MPQIIIFSYSPVFKRKISLAKVYGMPCKSEKGLLHCKMQTRHSYWLKVLILIGIKPELCCSGMSFAPV